MVQAKKHTLSVNRPAPLTEDEIKARKAQFYMQKREVFAQGILYNLCGNEASFPTAVAEPEVIVSKAVKMADLLMKALYVDEIPSFEPEAK